MKKYFVSKQQNIIGPFSLKEIEDKIKTSEVNLSDYIFLEEKEDWIPLMQHEHFNEKPAAKPPKIDQPDNNDVAKEASSEEITVDISEEDWFILRGEKKYGPFAYLELIKMLQEKSLYEYDFVWNPSLKKWNRIAELRDFTPEKIRLLNKEKRAEDVFFRRKHPRANFGGSLILHDNHRVWRGENLLISEGGCSIKVYNSMIQPGDEVFIHFKPNKDLPPFHAKGKIVSKRFDPNISDIEHPLIYGVKFNEIEGQTVKEIRSYIKKAA